MGFEATTTKILLPVTPVNANRNATYKVIYLCSHSRRLNSPAYQHPSTNNTLDVLAILDIGASFPTLNAFDMHLIDPHSGRRLLIQRCTGRYGRRCSEHRGWLWGRHRRGQYPRWCRAPPRGGTDGVCSTKTMAARDWLCCAGGGLYIYIALAKVART